MLISVKFVASIKEKTGCPEVIVEVDKGMSVRHMIELLREEYPKLCGPEDLVVSVNHRQVSEDLIMRDGDELSIMPPAHYY
jgi:molybdopterin converting factor small subunit